jgi:protein-L-isoaspartate(D-aspartate) O-methyltransferase
MTGNRNRPGEKTSPAPVVVPLDTTVAPVRRAAFPVQLKASPNVTGAIKKIAARALNTPATAPKGIKNQLSGGTGQPAATPKGVGLDSIAVRQRMVQKLAAQGVADARVLAAMGRVERHRFVDTALMNQAYEDTSLPIGLGQTISKPNVVARMLELLMHGKPGQLGRVLEIGTGCAYQAAVLSQLSSEVYSIERLRGLHEKAIANLRFLRLPNVHLLYGDGMLGYAKGAPYAGIVAAAGGQAIPDAWIAQLAVGGRLVAPMTTERGGQALIVVDKTAGGVTKSVLEAVHFVPLKSGLG